MTSHAQGVGARPTSNHLRLERGGYLDICTGFESPVGAAEKNARDPRIDELREMGLGYHWIQAAERIGFSAFLELWQTLDEQLAGDARRDVYVPQFRAFRAYQRNRFIRALSDEGLSPKEIRSRLQAELRESPSIRHILRVIGGCRD